jgi:putative transposase
MSPEGTTQCPVRTSATTSTSYSARKTALKVIPEDLQPKLWAYMAGIAKSHDMRALAIGGIEDHVQALIDMGPTLGIAKTVQVLKANSSRWMNDHTGIRFAWQVGYFACSVSRSQVPTVRQYIASQKSTIKRSTLLQSSSCC